MHLSNKGGNFDENKKLIAGAFVAVCAFMLVGCGQMTAKESLETAVTSVASIEASASKL